MLWDFFSLKGGLAGEQDKPFTCFVLRGLLVAGNLLFQDAVNLNLADRLTAPHQSGKCHHCLGVNWPASLGPAGRACFKSWDTQLMNHRSQDQQRRLPLPTCCCLDIKWLRLGRQPHGVFLMKSNDWTMDDGNLCVGSLQVQRGENKSRQWKV